MHDEQQNGDAPRLSVDSGGTFTDLMSFDGKTLSVHKQLSTPQTPEQAVIQGMRAIGLDKRAAPRWLAHGSTVGTNAALERKGVKTAYICNRGFADVLTIGRQTRANLYSLNPQPPLPPVPAEWCLETRGRISAQGERLETLEKEDIERLKRRLAELAPQAVAINLLFSFLDDTFEKMIEEALEKNYFVSRSSFVLPECGEYERGIATWLNSYIGPIMQNYLQRLEQRLKRTSVLIMQGQGQLIPARKASDYAVNLLLSGPAGGARAVEAYAELYKRDKMLGFDMGGTSTDVSVVDGEALMSHAGHIGPYPALIPMIDIHTIGSGGGSVVWLDKGGLLHVGPESAGSAPGPACYARGGTRPTVSDANFILGRLPERLAGQLHLNREAAVKAFSPLARSLEMSVEEAAEAAIAIVNEQMRQALKVMSVYKGYNSSEFTLLGFGAAAGLHLCAVAEGLAIKKAIVPAYAGVLSALGLWLSPEGIQKTVSVRKPIHELEQHQLDALHQRLREQIVLEAKSRRMKTHHIRSYMEARYLGQSSCLSLPWCAVAQLQRRFNEAYQKRHAYQLDTAVELLSIRMQTINESPLKLRDILLSGGQQAHHQYSRGQATGKPQKLQVDSDLKGPAILFSATGTSHLPPGWQLRCDAFNTLHFKRTGAADSARTRSAA